MLVQFSGGCGQNCLQELRRQGVARHAVVHRRIYQRLPGGPVLQASGHHVQGGVLTEKLRCRSWSCGEGVCMRYAGYGQASREVTPDTGKRHAKSALTACMLRVGLHIGPVTRAIKSYKSAGNKSGHL